MINTIEKAADEVFVPLTVGGGVRNLDNVRSLLWQVQTRFRLMPQLIILIL